jgi:predicted nuclease of predicted toxin-antitoxin system
VAVLRLMRLLFEENLSYRLVAALPDPYPDSAHVAGAGLEGAPGEALRRYAAGNDLVLVSKDSDFYHRSILRGAPPEVIWLRVGTPRLRKSQVCCVLAPWSFAGSWRTMTQPFSRREQANRSGQRTCGRRLQRTGELASAAFR